MPLLRRKAFTPRPLPDDFNPDTEYFVCKATGEVFDDYEEFFERVIVCNSLVWTCAVTGRPGLTYPEAIACEEKALSAIGRFPEHLRRPVLYLASRTHRTRINELNDDVYFYVRDVYFNNESVEAIHQDEWWEGRVVSSFLVTDDPHEEKENGGDMEREESKEEVPSDEPDWDHIRYRVQLWDDENDEYMEGEDGTIIVDTSCIRREKSGPASINQDKCKLFLKYHCEQVDLVWKVKEENVEKYGLSDCSYSDLICLPEPVFAQSKIPVKKQSKIKSGRTVEEIELIKEAKKKAQLAKSVQNKEIKEAKAKAKKEAREKAKPTPEERAAIKERQRVERERLREEQAAKIAEEKAKLREFKEQERQKAREEKKLIADKLREWNKPRDDLLCDDLQPFSSALSVPARLCPYFGEMVSVVEFLSTFGDHLGLETQFPAGVTLEILEKALFEADITGPLSDLLSFLLSSIFTCIEEEEQEEKELMKQEDKETTAARAGLIDDTTEPGELTYKELISSATSASQLCQLNHGTSLKDFQLDPLTVSEILRLHLLSSGAKGSSASVKFRYQSRGGYTSLDDAGIELKKDHPNILNGLATGNVFDLDVSSKLTIISTLINQLLSYASLRDIIDDSMDQYKSLSYELKQLQWAEQRREREEAQLRHKRKLEQKLVIAQQPNQPVNPTADGMEVDAAGDKPASADSNPVKSDQPAATDTNGSNVDEAAAKAARKLAKKIISETEKLDPSYLPQDTGRSRRKNAVAVEEIDWTDYDMTDWNSLEERYLTEEEIALLDSRRKEIETRKKQDFLQRETDMFENVKSLKRCVGSQPLGKDRWGRIYWHFHSIPCVYIETQEPELISKPCDLDSSLHSEKENFLPIKQQSGGSGGLSACSSTASLPNLTNGETMDATPSIPNSQLSEDPSYCEGSSWVYYNSNEEFENLITSLNNRGFRESVLKQRLLAYKRQIQQLNDQNPGYILDEHSIHENSVPTPACTNQNIKSRSRIAKGLTQDTSAQESLELNLREMLLDLEERIFVGSLGSLKIADRGAWRSAIESGCYDPQDKELCAQYRRTDATAESDESSDGVVVRDMARALLQLQHAVEAKFLCKPLGASEGDKRGRKKTKKEEVTPEQADNAAKILDNWTDSLVSSTSLSQVFLHMCTLESSIIWSKSALNARCKLCRRKGDAEKMLLCDMCDRGHHMYCLKPQVKDVPRGDWFCPECRPKTTRARRQSRRMSSFYDDYQMSDGGQEEEAESSDAASSAVTTNDSVYDEETASSSDDLELKHPKVKLLRTDSRGSSPSSPASAKDSKSRRSRTSTPEVDASRSRRSAAPSPEPLFNRRSKGSAAKTDSGSGSRKSKGSRPSSPQDKRDGGGSRSSLSLARANLSEEVAQIAQCEEVVREMMESDDCWPFLAPVNRREVPDYYTIIKRPMDCQTVLSKIKTFKYTQVSEMIADVRLMFKNCATYNEDNSDIFKMGQRLSKFFEKSIKSLRLEMNTAKRSRKM